MCIIDRNLDFIVKSIDRVATRLFFNLSFKYRRLVDKTDIQHDLMEKLINSSGKYNKKLGDEKVFISIVLNNHAKTVFSKLIMLYDNEDIISNFLIYDAVELPAEEVIEEEDFMEKIVIFSKEIKSLCKKFNQIYLPKRELVSLRNVLNHVLNKMSEDEFRKVNRVTQIKLAKYGEAYLKCGIDISKGGFYAVGSGISNIIKKYMDEGITDPKGIINKLDEVGIIYRRQSVLTLVYRERKRRNLGGLTNKKYGLTKVIAKYFDGGNGIIDPRQMYDKMHSLGYTCLSNTVRKILIRMKKERGIPLTYGSGAYIIKKLNEQA